MARTGVTGPELKPTAAAGSTPPQPLLRTNEDPNAFTAEIDEIIAEQVNDAPDTVVLLPPEYIHELPPDIDSPDASWRQSWLVQRCWKTTVAYEQLIGNKTSTSGTSTGSSSNIGTQPHPRFVAFVRRDPWTSLPLLAKPLGPPLDKFLDQNKAAMYERSSSTGGGGGGGGHRIKPAFRPLAYKWALHLASALEYVHAQDIILGDLSTSHCWLSGTGSSALSLLLVGFLDASFRDKDTGIKYLGGSCSGEPFHPLSRFTQGRSPEPSMPTDIFLWGCAVYELMVGHWPGYEEGAGRSRADMAAIITRQEWPRLEREYLGHLVKGCWTGEVGSSRRLREDLVEFLQTEGWQVDEGDDLQFDPSPLHTQITIR